MQHLQRAGAEGDGVESLGHGEAVELLHVTHRFGLFTAVRDIHLTIGAGEFFSFLGPSGCGKTTILRILSGFTEPSEGQVLIGGRNMRGIGPNKRPTALIFQNLALFPLMTVAENIAFGLEVRGVARLERRKKAEALLELIALPDIADKRVGELSGGQRQRVAIARALAVEPRVMLLDEPLSALDLKLRQHMRSELRNLQKKTGVTFIYITHDQGEALAMSDRVGVMSQGRLEQVGTAQEIYDHPATAFVASFVGENNALPGKIVATSGHEARIATEVGEFTGQLGQPMQVGASALLFVRPERLLLEASATGTAAANQIPGQFQQWSFEGAFAHLNLILANQQILLVQAVNDGHLPELRQGAGVTASFLPAHAVILPSAPLAKE